MDGQVAFGGGRVVAHLAPVGLVSACVSLAPGQPGMLLSSDAVNASRFAFWVLFFHVNFKRLLVLVVPIAFGALERLAGVARDVPSGSASNSRRAQNEVAFGALHAGRTAVDMIRASSDGRALKHICVGHRQRAGIVQA